MRFKFRNNGGDVIEVEAADEQAARHEAMLKRWGPAYGIYGPVYRGEGLALIDLQPA